MSIWALWHDSAIDKNKSSKFSLSLRTKKTWLFTGDFYKGVSSFVVIIIFAAPLMAIQYYTEQRLTLEWRRWLTNRLLMAYFSDQTFFSECLSAAKPS